MCLVRSIFANLCPIMIHLNALDFNVCRFEEVISFFWRSVYMSWQNHPLPLSSVPHFFLLSCSSKTESGYPLVLLKITCSKPGSNLLPKIVSRWTLMLVFLFLISSTSEYRRHVKLGSVCATRFLSQKVSGNIASRIRRGRVEERDSNQSTVDLIVNINIFFDRFDS